MTNKETIERLEYIKTHHTDPEDYELFDLAIKALKDSVVNENLTTERPQGEWVYRANEDLAINDYSCSNCGYWTDDKIWQFCPNCGAKMENDFCSKIRSDEE